MMTALNLMDKIKQITFIKIIVVYLRYLIGFAFVFASIVKIKGERFTTIPTSEPVGYFFEAMYQTGFYWNFLGWCQFIAGCLLMSQRFSTIGAIIFFPIILNVTMITYSVNFGMGTPTITLLMLMGTLFLLAWDYKKWIILFKPDHKIKIDLTNAPADRFMNNPVWVIAGILFMVLTVLLNFLKDQQLVAVWIFTMLSIGVASPIIVFIKEKRQNEFF